jgi:hypothetical protein
MPAVNDAELTAFRNQLTFATVKQLQFIEQFDNWIHADKLNVLSGFDAFPIKDTCFGVTHFIDNLIMQYNEEVQILEHDYFYYTRLWPNKKWATVGNLKPNAPLLMALPFPGYGIVHPQMDKLLEEATNKNVDIHLDCAWLPACRNIKFDFSHPAIKSFAISLSKGLALDWNRIAVRYSRTKNETDAITIANKFSMINEICLSVGYEYMQKFNMNFLWEKHGSNYSQICKEFKVIPTCVIHSVKDPKTGKPKGTRDLLLSLSL